MQQALKLGIGFLPLAQAVLDALEIWTQDLSVNQLKPLVTQIFPLLDDYLHLSTKTGSTLNAKQCVLTYIKKFLIHTCFCTYFRI